MKTTTIKAQGKRGKVVFVEVPVAPPPVNEEDDRDRFTPEYYQAREQFAFVQNTGEFYAGELQEIQDKIDAEATVSEAGRERGIVPGRATRSEWYNVALELRQEAAEDLRLATQADREAAGNRAVNRRARQIGERVEFVQVGGQTFERKWTGGSAAAARRETSRINRETQAAALEYLKYRLVDYGYKESTVEGLSYLQSRRLVAEIGHGVLQQGNVGRVSKKERERIVIEQSTPARRLDASAIAINPRAAKGLDKWTRYELALVKAGRENEIQVLPDLRERNTPAFVDYPGGRRPRERRSTNTIDF